MQLTPLIVLYFNAVFVLSDDLHGRYVHNDEAHSYDIISTNGNDEIHNTKIVSSPVTNNCTLYSSECVYN